MTNDVLDKLKAKFTYDPVNWEKVVELVNNNQPISFYSWECPPRQKVKDEKNRTWINFDIDIEGVVGGKKLDEFTEFPRLTSQSDNERWFIDEILPQIPNATYTKIVADTNAFYICPLSVEILGEEKIEILSKRFQTALQEAGKKLFGDKSPNIVLLTELKKKFNKEYDMFFTLVYESFTDEGSPYVPKNIYEHWVERVSEHVGLTDDEKAEKFDMIKRSISTYAAEGMLISLFNTQGVLPNPVWANWEEPPENGVTTEILRTRYGLAEIPVIYFVPKEEHQH